MNPNGRLILIVDDDPDMQVFVATLLAEGGFRPFAVCGEEALRLARTLRPALIVLGAPIHGASGADLYSALRTDPLLKRIPVLLLSTIPRKSYLHYQRMQENRQGRPLPEPDDFLTKPPEAEELLRRVERLIRAEPGLRAAKGTPRAGARRTPARQDTEPRVMTKPPLGRLVPRG